MHTRWACLSAGSSSTLLATAFSKCRSCLCCFVFNLSRPSSSCSKRCDPHPALCCVWHSSASFMHLAPWTPSSGIARSDVCSGHVHYSHRRVWCSNGLCVCHSLHAPALVRARLLQVQLASLRCPRLVCGLLQHLARGWMGLPRMFSTSSAHHF